MASRNPLRYRVECKDSVCAFYEPIAAFNVQIVAVDYADRCAHSNAHNSYRVVDTCKRGVERIMWHAKSGARVSA